MKTPQEKKRLSYAKDRRNTYGENSKSSRKNIPLSKALDIRAERHNQDRFTKLMASSTDVDDLIAIENRVKSTDPREWRKGPDEPLGIVLERKQSRSKK